MSDEPGSSPWVDPNEVPRSEQPGWPLRDIGVVCQWMAAGFDFDSATRWFEVWGADHQPTELQPWHAAGFGPRVSRTWAMVGVEVDEAREWREFGCSVKDAALFGSLDALRRWRDLGFSLKRARKWRRIPEISRPGIAAEWRSLGCSPAQAASWLEVPGVKGPSDVRFWKSHGCSPGQARGWLALTGISGPESVEEWLKAQMTLESARQWVGVLGGPLEEAAEWIAIGCTSKETAAWLELTCIGAAGDVLPWRDAGLRARDLRRWERALAPHRPGDPRMTPDFVLAWTFAGCSPREAVRCARAALEPVDLLRLRAHGVSPGNAPEFTGYARPSPARGTNEPLQRPEQTRPSQECCEGRHDACDRPKQCLCGCHCWHDERQFDYRLQGAEVGGNPPRFLYGAGRARKCRSFDPTRHAMCRAATRCSCPCHCWHASLTPVTAAKGIGKAKVPKKTAAKR